MVTKRATHLKKFLGKRYDREEKERIFKRLLSLYREGQKAPIIRDIMQAEGYRRVDGGDLTLSWVANRLEKVRAWDTDKRNHHRNGPIKEVYARPRSGQASQAETPLQLISAVLESNIAQDLKLKIVEVLSRHN